MTKVDQQVARLSKPRHDDPPQIHALLERVGRSHGADGTRAEVMAGVLAARGWGTTTLGDGGPRGTSPTSSTEREALAERTPLSAWKTVEVDYHRSVQALQKAAEDHEHQLLRILGHASDQDPIPGGTGYCECCTRFCRPDPTRDRAEDRLKAGLCPACYRAYLRAGRPFPLGDWLRRRRASLTDERGQVHAPTEEVA